MASAPRQLPADAPTERLPEDLPDVPDSWERLGREELRYGARAGWEHRETGLVVTVERDRKPTQMHTPMTSKDDTGFHAQVQPERSGKGNRNLTYEFGSKDVSYEAVVRFMAKYPDGDFDVPDGWPWALRSPVEW